MMTIVYDELIWNVNSIFKYIIVIISAGTQQLKTSSNGLTMKVVYDGCYWPAMAILYSKIEEK